MHEDKPPEDLRSANVDVSMEDQSPGFAGEEIFQGFICYVCQDVLYKPVVLVCGHVSCFWCIHRTMNGSKQSQCPTCGHPYSYFSAICQLFHFLLMKMYPVAYKRRETQVLEEEKKSGNFSPQFDGHLAKSHTNKEENLLSYQLDSVSTSSQIKSYPGACSTGNRKPSVTMEPSESSLLLQENVTNLPERRFAANFETTKDFTIEGNIMPLNDLKNGSSKHVSIDDVQCAVCKQLLFQPAVLNCGDVCCHSCIVVQADETIHCQVCQSLHPVGFPKIFLELDRFLAECFSKEYALRRETVLQRKVHFQLNNPPTCEIQAQKRTKSSGWGSTKVHVGVGCDSCGMYPIIGQRYKCQDCSEAIGFDLCGYCYNTRSKRPGRFNQQHTQEHKFELIPLNRMYGLLFRLVAELSADDSTTPAVPDDTSRYSADGSPPNSSSDASETP